MQNEPASFKLRWRRPDGSLDDVSYQYDPGGPAMELTFRQWVNRCIRVGSENGKEFVGQVDEKTGVAVCTLTQSEYHVFSKREDRAQLILETEEGRKEVWVTSPLLSEQPPPNKRAIQVYHTLYEFQRAINGTDAEKLVRRWQGIDPDEDADLDLAEGLNRTAEPALGVGAPGRPVEWEREPPVRELPSVEALALEFAEKMGVTLTDENRPFFEERARTRRDAMARAPVLNVPDIEHEEIQEAVVLARDPESGEMKVTHTYHDLHAPQGETTTSIPDEQAHADMTHTVVDCVWKGYTLPLSLKIVAKTIRTGQIWDWDKIAARAKNEPKGTPFGYTEPVDDICDFMLREQRNEGTHGYDMTWPEIHLAPSNDGPTFCGGAIFVKEEDDGTTTTLTPWILPIRFKQCGSVPFGPMCKDCVVALEAMPEDDPRLIPPDCNCDEMRATMMQSRFDRPEGEGPGWKCPVHGSMDLGLDLDGNPIDVESFSEWVTYETADPVKDVVLGHLQALGTLPTEDNIRRSIQYFKSKGLFGEKVDEDGAVTRIRASGQEWDELAHSYEHEPGQMLPDEARHMRIRKGEPESLDFHKSVGQLIAELLVGRYSEDVDKETEYIEGVLIPRVKARIGNSYVLLHFIGEAARRDTPDYAKDLIPWVMQRLDPNYVEGQPQATNSRHFYTGPSSDPTYDMVVGDATPGWTEDSARGHLSALVGTGVLVRRAWPDERIAIEAHRIYRKWVKLNTNSKEAVDASKPDMEGGVDEGR